MPFVTWSVLVGSFTGIMCAASTSPSCVLHTAHEWPYAASTSFWKLLSRTALCTVTNSRCWGVLRCVGTGAGLDAGTAEIELSTFGLRCQYAEFRIYSR